MTPHKDEELEKEVLVKGKLIKEYDNGNVRISFSPDERCPEFPAFEMNIPKEMIVNAAGYIKPKVEDYGIPGGVIKNIANKISYQYVRRDKIGIDAEKLAERMNKFWEIGLGANRTERFNALVKIVSANAKDIIKINED